MPPLRLTSLEPEGTREGLAWIEDHRAIRYMHFKPFALALKAKALYLANRIPEALEAIKEAERQAEISEERWWCAELHRLRGVFLAAMGADEGQMRRHQHSKGAEVGFAGETRRSNLYRIPPPKSEPVRGTWIATTTLLTAWSALPLVQQFKIPSSATVCSVYTVRRRQGQARFG
jgi:hypothetical protein